MQENRKGENDGFFQRHNAKIEIQGASFLRMTAFQFTRLPRNARSLPNVSIPRLNDVNARGHLAVLKKGEGTEIYIDLLTDDRLLRVPTTP
jgi:hypothetical protein